MANNVMPTHGYYSLLRWASNPTRDEARNVGVLLISSNGEFGGIRHTSVGAISSRLVEQGIMDSLLSGLERRFAAEVKPTLKEVQELQASLDRSLYLTEPKPTAVFDAEETLNALYRTYVATSGGPRQPTKSVVLDSVVKALRASRVDVRRAQYLSDYIFDAIIVRAPGRDPAVLDILSFATQNRDWTATERDAGHFLFALERVEADGLAVVRPPQENSHENAFRSYERVTGWLSDADVPITEPAGVVPAVQALG
jgi:hypothetical protein